MSYTEWMEFISFVETILWLFVAWFSGVCLGYLIGFKNGSGS